MIPFIYPKIGSFSLGSLTGGFSPWDILLAGLIGIIDLNPLLDLLFTPVAWAITFLVGN